MNSKIYTIFAAGFQSGHFLRIGDNDAINMYMKYAIEHDRLKRKS